LGIRGTARQGGEKKQLGGPPGAKKSVRQGRENGSIKISAGGPWQQGEGADGTLITSQAGQKIIRRVEGECPALLYQRTGGVGRVTRITLRICTRRQILRRNDSKLDRAQRTYCYVVEKKKAREEMEIRGVLNRHYPIDGQRRGNRKGERLTI